MAWTGTALLLLGGEHALSLELLPVTKVSPTVLLYRCVHFVCVCFFSLSEKRKLTHAVQIAEAYKCFNTSRQY